MNEITVLIELDARTWMPSAIFYNGATDTETAKLRGIAELMLKALHGREAAPLEEPEP